MKAAYYASSIGEFLAALPQTVLGYLAASHGHDLEPLQRNAWIGQIELLKRELSKVQDGWIAFEFAIPRMGKRADVVLVVSGIIVIIEFKIGTERHDRSAIEQAVDYALDLKNFHAGSHDRYIVPIVCATGADGGSFELKWSPDGVAQPLLSNGSELGKLVEAIVSSTPQQEKLYANQWAASGYKPTPTIIEAAQALYRGHRVEEITRSDAGAKNLSQTTACLSEIIEKTKADREKAICFVTGVPGAGKTLAGLNLITQRAKAHEDEHAVFLSGNGPLVEVLREALARDELQRSKAAGEPIIKADAERKVRSFVQNIHHFRDEGLRNPAAPAERVVVFDEAQRAWDQAQVSKFMKQKKGVENFEMSESEFLISVMDRHEDWCIIVCLIGGGQEINVGEAGLPEWFLALQRRFAHWKVYTSPALSHRDYHWGQKTNDLVSGLNSQSLDELHLSVSVRSFRAEKLSAFVGALVAGNVEEARDLYGAIKATYPIVVTRDLAQARAWLRSKARGSERIGLVASSGASRLKPEGINVHEKIDARYWFLNNSTDVRSSFYLEDPATEFDIQGLELDWIGVCWEADFRYSNGRWSHHRFRGTNWQNVASSAQQTYLANAYRVLLTRARQGMIIYLPRGDRSDPTRDPSWYDETTKLLERCGIPIAM